MMPLIGSDKITVTDNRITLEVKGMEVTYGGIAKGYAVDEAIKAIKTTGVEQAIITIGGENCTLGTKPDGKPWEVALVNPANTSQLLAAFEWTGERAISTSGNYERYFSPDKKVNHLMNPKTGFPWQTLRV